MQERPRCTRRLRSSFLRYILDGAVSFEGPTRDGGWKRVEPPGGIVREVAARAREWVPPHRQLPVPRPTPPTQIARVRLREALPPSLRLEITAHDGAMQLLRVRYGEGGREIVISTDQAPELAGWLARGDDDAPLPFIEFARPEWGPERRWSLRARRIFECSRETSAAGAGLQR
jgi:hypothetical protein